VGVCEAIQDSLCIYVLDKDYTISTTIMLRCRKKNHNVNDDEFLDERPARNYLQSPESWAEPTMEDAVPANGGASKNILRAKSMLEMNVIQDMVQFGEEIDALQASDDEAGDGFFIDTSDDVQCEEDQHDNLRFLSLASSTDSLIHTTKPAYPQPKLSSMRRVMSVASLSSVHKFNPLLAAKQSIHTISEECEDLNLKSNTSKNDSSIRNRTVSKPSDPINIKNAGSDSIEKSNHPDPSTTLDNGSQIINGRRRSSRYRKPSGGMPLRSSLKGSSNSLSSMSLRSSLKDSTNNLQSSLTSVTGSNSGMCLEDTTHTIESQVSSSMKRNVSFSSLEIRSYNITLGDAPTYGAVSLDWEYDPSATQEHEVDSYETYRETNPPRNKVELLMPASHRQYLLLREGGLSRREIDLAMDEAKRVAKQRQVTVRRLRLQSVEEVVEKTKKRFSFGKKSGSKSSASD